MVFGVKKQPFVSQTQQTGETSEVSGVPNKLSTHVVCRKTGPPQTRKFVVRLSKRAQIEQWGCLTETAKSGSPKLGHLGAKNWGDPQGVIRIQRAFGRLFEHRGEGERIFNALKGFLTHF